MPRPSDIENEALVEELTKSLVTVYGGAKDDLMKLLAKSSLSEFKEARVKSLLKQVRGIVEKLDVASAQYAANSIPKAYKAGQKIAGTSLLDIGVKSVPDWSARIHTAAVDVIAQQMALDALEKNGTVYNNIARALQRTKQTVLTEEQINRQIAQGVIQGETRRITSKRISDQLVQELGEGKLLTAGSKQFAPEDYAELLARTRTREAVTNGIINSAQQVGIDLFQVSVHDNPCPVCQAFQGRVYSISGENEHFPKLERKPPFHPRCKHVMVPVTEKHLKRLGQFDAAKKLSNDPNAEIVDNASYLKFLEDHPQRTDPVRRPAPPEPPKPPVVDAIPRGKAGADEFGARLTPVEGKALGGSTGAKLFVDDEGVRWVVKAYGGNELQAQNEYLANRLYALNGINVPEARLATIDGKANVALRFIEDKGAVVAGSAHKAALQKINAFQKGFVTDAFVANWDAVGLNFDNVMLVPGKATKVWRLDQGGSLLFRAQGAPKGAAFGGSVGELSTLRDAYKNANTAYVFGGISDADIAKQIGALLKNVKAADIAGAIEDAGITGAQAAQLQKTLEARLASLKATRNDIIAKGKKAAIRKSEGLPGARRTQTHDRVATSSLSLDQQFAEKNKRLQQGEFAALRNYTGSGFSSINKAAWKKGKGDEALDSLLWGDDLPGWVGYSQRKIGNVPNRVEIMEKWKSGEWGEAWWSAYSSSAIVPGGTYGNSFNGFNFIIKNHGKQGSYVGNHSRIKHEKELLYGRNSAFRVVGWDAKYGEYYVFLEEVEGEIPMTQPAPPQIDSEKFLDAWRKEYNKLNGDTSKVRLEDFKK